MSESGIIEIPSERDRRRRQKYSSLVYLLTSLFLIISFLQWTGFKFVPALNTYFKGHFFLPLFLLAVAVILISIFVFVEDFRFHAPINWIVVFVIVEFITLGLTSAIVHTSFPRFGASILVVICMFILFSAVGIYVPRDLTYDIAILFACTILFFIASILFLCLAVLAGMHFSVLFYALSIEGTGVMFMLYHTQTIHGARYAEMRVKDFLLAPLLLYSDFIILYLITLFLLKSVLDDDKHLYAFKDIFAETTTPTLDITESPEDVQP